MYSVDPNVLIQMIKQGQNPQQLMLKILTEQANTPLTQNLLTLAKNGQTQELENVVRNIYSQQGGDDFDRDFVAFKRAIGYTN